MVWTLAPWLLFPNLPLDLIEALTYGREWQLGYDKLPPLPWWTVEILYRLFHADIAYYAFAQVTVVAAFACVFRLALTLTNARAALAAVLIIDGLHYFTSTSPKFNHDVIQLPFWALAGVSYYYALRTQRLVHWVLLGIALGGAFWAKYFVAMLAVPLALFILLDRDARASLRTAGPYVTAMVALVIAAPHLVWLVQNDFLPLHYVEARATPPRGWYDYGWRPLEFALGQAAWLLPSLAISANLLVARREVASFNVDAFSRRIVTLLTFGPCALLLAASAYHRRQADRHVGLSAVAVPRALADAAHRPGHGAQALHSPRSDLGCRHAGLRDRVCHLHGGRSADTADLSRRAVSRPRGRARARRALCQGNRAAGRLRHRADVLRRQCQPLRQGSAAHGDRRRPLAACPGSILPI